jgi:hypothetical protein
MAAAVAAKERADVGSYERYRRQSEEMVLSNAPKQADALGRTT